MSREAGSASGGKQELPRLTYTYAALEPYIDAKTMEIHHTKHHQTYVDKLNSALEKYPALQAKPVEELLKNLDSLKVDEADRTAIRNHGGGHLNHSLFWKILDPANQKDKKLITDLNHDFGSVEEFKKQFTDVATKLFGSGWAWLARDGNGKLHLHGLPNQDSPYLHGHTPVIGLDVWEHAYYLKYQNRRAEYIENWWQVLKLI
jgi:Fe-Mn family superoxide dismutase